MNMELGINREEFTKSEVEKKIDIDKRHQLPYEGKALVDFLIEKQNANKYEGELLPIAEDFEKIYKKIPEATKRIIEEYKLLCEKWHLEPGLIKLYMVGGRIKGKPLSIDSDIDLLICAENPKKSTHALLCNSKILHDRYKDFDDVLDAQSRLITEITAIPLRVCKELGISNQFHLVGGEGGYSPEKDTGNERDSLLIGIG